RHTRFSRDWSSDVCSSDLNGRRMNRIRKVQNTDVDQSLQILFPRASVGTATLPVGDACGAYAMLFADDSAMTTNLVAVPLGTTEIGRASCRERVCGSVCAD